MKPIKLKCKVLTFDARLDRIPDLDERNRNFPVRDAVPRKPRSWSWRCQKHLNQKKEGSCVGHGISHELIAKPVECLSVDHEYARQLYFDAQRTDGMPGGSYPGAFPFYEGTSVKAGMNVARKRGLFDSFLWAFSLLDVLNGISWLGPAVFGIDFYEGMMRTDDKGFIHPTGSVMGGHCILGKSIKVVSGASKGFVTLHNSWGEEWGMGGDAYLNFDELEEILKNKGECSFAQGRHPLPKTTRRKR